MEACASTYSASKLGALAAQQIMSEGEREIMQEDAYVSRLHMMERVEAVEKM